MSSDIRNHYGDNYALDVEARVEALRKVHAQKVQSLSATVSALQNQIEALRKESQEHRRSATIAGLQKYIQERELVVDALKEMVVTTSNGKLTREDVDDLVLRRTVGAPTRFRPQTIESLTSELATMEQRYNSARRASKEHKTSLQQCQKDLEMERSRGVQQTRQIAILEARCEELSASMHHASEVAAQVAMLEDVEVKAAALAQRYAQARESMQEYKERWEHGSAALAQARAELEGQNRECLRLQKALVELQAETHQLRLERDDVHSVLHAESESSRSRLEREREAAMAALKEAESGILLLKEQHEKDLHALRMDLARLQSEVEASHTRYEELQEKYEQEKVDWAMDRDREVLRLNTEIRVWRQAAEREKKSAQNATERELRKQQRAHQLAILTLKKQFADEINGLARASEDKMWSLAEEHSKDIALMSEQMKKEREAEVAELESRYSELEQRLSPRSNLTPVSAFRKYTSPTDRSDQPRAPYPETPSDIGASAFALASGGASIRPSTEWFAPGSNGVHRGAVAATGSIGGAAVSTEELEKLKGDLASANASIATLEGEKSRLMQERDALVGEKDTLLAEKRRLEGQNQELRLSIVELQEKITALQTKLTAAESNILPTPRNRNAESLERATRTQLKNLRTELQEKSAALDAELEKSAALTREVALLKDQIHDLERQLRAAKLLSNAASASPVVSTPLLGATGAAPAQRRPSSRSSISSTLTAAIPPLEDLPPRITPAITTITSAPTERSASMHPLPDRISTNTYPREETRVEDSTTSTISLRATTTNDSTPAAAETPQASDASPSVVGDATAPTETPPDADKKAPSHAEDSADTATATDTAISIQTPAKADDPTAATPQEESPLQELSSDTVLDTVPDTAAEATPNREFEEPAESLPGDANPVGSEVSELKDDNDEEITVDAGAIPATLTAANTSTTTTATTTTTTEALQPLDPEDVTAAAEVPSIEPTETTHTIEMSPLSETERPSLLLQKSPESAHPPFVLQSVVPMGSVEEPIGVHNKDVSHQEAKDSEMESSALESIHSGVGQLSALPSADTESSSRREGKEEDSALAAPGERRRSSLDVPVEGGREPDGAMKKIESALASARGFQKTPRLSGAEGSTPVVYSSTELAPKLAQLLENSHALGNGFDFDEEDFDDDIEI